ncbi:MAG: LysM peptidoglycan-binding domain-containing protein [Chloroflexota bacterium]
MSSTIQRIMFMVLLMAGLLVVVGVAGAQDEEECGVQYTVQPGDNLTRIARICETTVEALRDANPGVVSLIRPGDVLNIVSEQGGLAGTPVVALTPIAGPIGTQITAVANGLPASTPVQVSLGESVTVPLISSNATTDTNGALAIRLTVPGNISVGTPLVVSIAAAGSTTATSNAFTVNGSPFGVGGVDPNVFPQSPAPVAVQPQGVFFGNVNVYMVAPQGSANAGGVATVCGDTIVPVQIAVNQTVAPITAGVDALLRFDAAAFGLPDLSNPLAGSGLVIDEILIDNGEAIISLNGALTTSDTCQIGRIQGQLEATALQYATVSSVSVFVNGVQLGS